MKVWIATREPYHDNSTILFVFGNEEKARTWIRMQHTGAYWKVSQDVNNEYRSGTHIWVVKRFSVNHEPHWGGRLFGSAKEAQDWMCSLEADCALVDDYAVTEMEVQ